MKRNGFWNTKPTTLRRGLSLLLALTLLLTLLPQAAPVARADSYSGTCGDNLTWTFDPDTGALTIEGSGAMESYYLYSTPWSGYKERITSVSLPAGLTCIGDYAFFSCNRLTSVTIPENVNTIGVEAFSYCTGLTSITILEGVTSIGGGAFYNCTGLTEMMIPESVTTIGDYAFCDCTGLTEMMIPESVTTIGDYAFSDCSGLSSVTIPESVASIGSEAFSSCDSLALLVNDSATCSIGESNNTLGKAGSTLLMGYAGSTTEAYAQKFGYSFLSLGTNPQSVCGADGDHLTWTLDVEAGRLTISGSGAMADYESYGNKAPWYIYRILIASVVLPDGLSSIGSYAFRGCTGLTEVTIPESVTTIGERAFEGCAGLTSVTIPESVTSISPSMFRGCIGLTSVTIQESVTSIGNGAFSGCTGLIELTIPESVAYIGNYAFSGCTGLTEVTIPESVSSLNVSVFSGCTGLNEVTIPESVTSISGSAFSGCIGLIEVTIPESVTYIGNYAFSDCTGLTKVTIPESVTSIGYSAFSGCTALASAVVQNFNCKLEQLVFPQATTLYGYMYSTTQQYANARGNCFISIGYLVLQGTCGADGNNLTYFLDTETRSLIIEGSGTMLDYFIYSPAPWYMARACIDFVSLPEGLNSIGSYAFYGCAALTSLTIPESVTSIGDEAFYNCTGLISITIPESITSIGNYAFSSCYGLTEVTIPESITSIGSNAFSNCISLVLLVNNSATCSIEGGGSTLGNAQRTLLMGYAGSTTEAYAQQYNYTFLPLGTSLQLEGICGADGDNLTWTLELDTDSLTGSLSISGSGAMQEFGYNQAPWYPYRSLITSLSLPNQLTSIGKYAFSDCITLTEVTIPEGVESIGYSAFSGCTGLTAVTIPGSVSSIGDCAFYNCAGLTEVTIPEGVTIIGNSAFSGCTGLTSITIPEGVESIGNNAFYNCTGLTSITISEGVASIGSYAFYNCAGLTEVTISEGVTSIGSYAFYNCAGLTELTLPDSLVTIGDGAFCKCSSIIKISLPDGLQKLGVQMAGYDRYSGVFEGCVSLTEVKIPNNVTTIGSAAFYGCTGLSEVTIPEAVSKIGSFAFTGCSGLKQLLFRGNQAYISTAVWETEDTLEDLTRYESGKNMLGPHEQVVIYGSRTNSDGDTHDTYYSGDGGHVYALDMSPRYYAEKFGYTFYATDVFEDVRQGKYYTIPVAWAYGRGITSGKDDTHFAPNETCTRGQVVTFLWNAMGKPAPTITDCPFVDVKPGKYYYDAMLWALETGVTSGKDDTHFAPNETCTRGQVVTFIWNAMGKPEPTITDCPFVDTKPGKYYYNAMLWALENGVTSGTDATHFGPNQTCTRGQVVTFLYNALS